MNNRFFSRCILASIAIAAICAETAEAKERSVPVTQLKATALHEVATPLVLDTIDVHRKPFNEQSYLRDGIGFEALKTENGTVTADSADTFTLPRSVSGKHAIQLLAFNIDADRYCRATLRIASTDLLELYVNNQLKETNKKLSVSLKKAKEISAALTLEPRRYTVVVKRLASGIDSIGNALKISLKLKGSDTLAQVAFSTDAQRRIITNDLLEGKRITSCGISPSGKYYYFFTNDVQVGGKSSWACAVKEVASGKVICRATSYDMLRWMPNSDALCYVRQGENGRDIYTLDVATLDETKIAEGLTFSSFAVAPNGRYLALTIRDNIETDKGDFTRLLSPSQRGGGFLARENIALYNISTKTTQLLTFGRTSLSLVDISRDSRWLLMMTSVEDLSIGRPYSRSALYRYDVEAQQLDTLLEDRFIDGANFSPDATQLVAIGSGEAFGGIGLHVAEGQTSNMYNKQIFIFNIADKKARATSDFKPSTDNAVWHTDGKIYLTTTDRDCKNVYCYDPKAERYTRLPMPAEVVSKFTVADNANTALALGQSATNPNRLYSFNLKNGKSALLEAPYRERLSELALATVEEWNFTSADGTEIQGRYYLPSGFDAAKKYPMVVYYYGGTTPSSRLFDHTYPPLVYAAQGYVVYVLNPSGCTGYGQEFAARHSNAWGIKTADEIIRGTQLFFRSHPYVDSAKIGCVGASYGGFMTQYLQTRTKMFAAAVSHAGISNITSYWGEGYWGWGYSLAASANSYPWNNPKLYTEQSPLFAADKISTPLLLLHGGEDTNVPIGESIQMYNALKLLNKTVEFVTVSGENHVIRTYQKRIDFNKHIFAWFAKWLKGEPEWWKALHPER